MTLTDTRPGTPLAVCVEAPAPHAARLGYALDELLRGIGLRAVPARRDEATLYLGTEPEAAPPGALRLRAHLGEPRPTPSLDAMGALALDGEAWPLPTGPGGAPSADPRLIVEADAVGSAFWWLVGVQERGAPRDAHGRFPFSASLQARIEADRGAEAPGAAWRPAVDAYRRWLGQALQAVGVHVPGRDWGGHDWAVALTHDLDATKTDRLRALVGGLAAFDPVRAVRRALGPDDRWRSVEALVALGERHGARPTVFVKTGDGAPEDVPLPRRDPRLRALVRSGRVEVGLHPSYAAGRGPGLGAEAARLTALTGHAPALVRTHFLRWAEPATPDALVEAGFAVDSTLGFSHRPGARRGTLQPFRLWDAAGEAPSSLWEVPLTIMDTTLAVHLGLDGDALDDALVTGLDAARRTGGCAVMLWHNDMGLGRPWEARLGHFRRALDTAARDGARLGGLGEVIGAHGLAVRRSDVP